MSDGDFGFDGSDETPTACPDCGLDGGEHVGDCPNDARDAEALRVVLDASEP